ncbi:MAG: hypothetical protein HYR60_31075 [Acidobacteria bacterium]|nr:hypothetical protein [Acidobacteriota bacterium]
MFVSRAVLVFALIVPVWADVTYSKEVSRIMQARCQQCHRAGDIAPFALSNYEDAKTYAEDIKRVVTDRIMPPWKPAAGFNSFRDSYALTDEQRTQILDWIAGGAQEGDPADLPEPLPVKETPWELGDPDLILAMPKYTPPVRPSDTYRCFVLPTDLDETRFVSAVQSAPGQKQIVHHVLIYVDETGDSEKLDGKDGQPGYTCFGGPNVRIGIGGLLGGWAPGARTRHLPEGIGLLLPKKSRLVLQVHYHPSGLTLEDQTQIGIWFKPKDSVNKRLVNIPILNDRFEIPPGAADHEVKAQQAVLPFLTGKAITVAPHMHLLGRKIKVELEKLNGQKEPMILIDNWDFNWQGFYTFEEPVTLPSFSTVRVTANYDNSENNPKNPNKPLKAVRWGEGTDDEMCIAFIGVVFDNENLIPFRRK